MSSNNDEQDKSKVQNLVQLNIIREYFEMYPNLEIHGSSGFEGISKANEKDRLII